MTPLLRGAMEHAALGESLPAMSRVSFPFRWLFKLAAGGVYAAASPLTRRQREVNRSLLAACQHLDTRLTQLAAPTPAPTHRLRGLPRDGVGDGGPQSFPAVNNEYSLMLWAERVALYATVYGVRPKKVLEIGTYKGGRPASSWPL